jgi:hypothetical protein
MASIGGPGNGGGAAAAQPSPAQALEFLMLLQQLKV